MPFRRAIRTRDRDEVFVRGFRAPRTASIDRVTGYMFVSDYSKGIENQLNYFGDEINLIRPADAGLDYRYYNVRQCLRYDPVPGIVVPIFCNEVGLVEVPFNYSIVVGPTYRGSIEQFQGRLFTAQRYRTRIETLQNVSEIQQYTYASRRTETLPSVGAVNAMGDDASGNIYFVQGNGEIYVLEPS